MDGRALFSTFTIIVVMFPARIKLISTINPRLMRTLAEFPFPAFLTVGLCHKGWIRRQSGKQTKGNHKGLLQLRA
jgi:hypothetical protein